MTIHRNHNSIEAYRERGFKLNSGATSDPARVLGKKASWHNIVAQETRAECLNEIEAELGRSLSWTEMDTIFTIQNHTQFGVTTRVSVTLDEEPTDV